MTAVPVVAPDPSAVELPPHVRTAFGVADAQRRQVAWAGRPAWLCDSILIRPVADNAMAAWSSGVLDGLRVEGLRPARPVRASDGRWVVAGWTACRYVPGTLEPRYVEMVEAALRLHGALAAVSRPRLLDDRDDLLTGSAAAAWGEQRLTLPAAAGGELFTELAAYRRSIRLPSQVVHAELFGAVLFDTEDVPTLIDLVPSWRPVEWAVAVLVVDALAWGGAEESLLDRYSHLDEWPQALLRAVLYRLALHARHPEGSARTLRGLERAAGLVSDRI